MTLTSGTTTVFRARPVYVSVPDLAVTETIDGQPADPGTDWTGSYQIGWSTSQDELPATWLDGPTLTSDIPAGLWLIWAGITTSQEQPASPLGWLNVI